MDDYFRQRQDMVKLLKKEGIQNSKVLNAMLKVPRHLFVPIDEREKAYMNLPLPIGHYQTISQPFIVAFMTEAAQVNKNSKCLEIGTGSGYQAALLAEICDEVYTIEIIKDLANTSAEIFQKLNYINIFSKIGDGNTGWPEQALYNVIIVTAASKEIPKNLISQLAVDGHMILPLEEEIGKQVLMRITKTSKNNFYMEKLLDVIFVPLVKD